MITPQLLDYIRQQISAGTPKDDIQKALQSQGWNVAEVGEAFAALNPAPAPVPPPVQPPAPVTPAASQIQPVGPAQPMVPQPASVIVQPAVTITPSAAPVTRIAMPVTAAPKKSYALLTTLIIILLLIVAAGAAAAFVPAIRDPLFSMLAPHAPSDLSVSLQSVATSTTEFQASTFSTSSPQNKVQNISVGVSSSITLDSSGLTTQSLSPTLSGVASNISTVAILVGPFGAWGSAEVQVVNGHWLYKAPRALAVGSYTVTVFPLLRASGDLGKDILTDKIFDSKDYVKGTLLITNQNGSTAPSGPAPVCTLSASPQTVNVGDKVTLTWTSQNASAVSMFSDSSGEIMMPNGSIKVTASSKTPGTPYGNTYIMYVLGPGGGSDGKYNCGVEITVNSKTNISITIDPSALVSTSNNPTITGTALNTKSVSAQLYDSNGQTLAFNIHIPVTNGRWSTSFFGGPSQPTNSLTAGIYTIKMSSDDGAIVHFGASTLKITE